MDILTLITSAISLLLLVFLFSVFTLMMYALIFGAPYVGLAQHRINSMIKLLNLKKGDKLVDIGSGDGRIVIALAKLGIESHGYEINPMLVAWSRFKIRRLGLKSKAFIHFKSYWLENLNKYTAVAVYGISHMMPRLEKKLTKDLKPGSKIVSNYYGFPKLKPKKQINKVWYYEIK